MKNSIEENLNLKYVQASSEDESFIRELLDKLHGDQSNFDINKFIIAKVDNMIVGCVRVKVFSDGCLELSSLAVDEEFQRKGIGSKLVEEILKKEKNRPIYLLTLKSKERFYNKFGFDIIDTKDLPNIFKEELNRVANLVFVKDLEIVAMAI